MSSWLLVAIGFVILLGVIVLVRLAPALFAGTVDREIMAMPMSPLQKRAWWVLAISSATLVNRETPQLCWGGTQSLTITGVS